MSDLELAYLAGFFDGEGCITIACNRSRYYALQVSIAQKDKAYLEQVQLEYSGRFQVNNSGIWVLFFSTQSSKKLLSDLKPFLKGKKLQAQVALEFQSYRDLNRCGRGSRLTEENSSVYKACYDKLHSLR